ncbi:MAG: hypothetical protein KUA43_08525 [Hoeflea sp.]|uniref:hypothetical protein n=1 Tax=Hoeflea sp. TaxID=1940281 RepID=UPI001D5A20BD|nr:hypothetical protein [Hoeflea sp.]MBU4529709.1 hypothetical protein [Alphaproteobacteria bacterium]MBU4543270.1 hypothetical protein [Alphaproteobacteria bacterium]MBU4552457.1 hypothetical protein [Alphaproteobacteria bacterium]MBV1723473.1 hypothetical protein [Hoeflea sp.]MBV1762922.1 hypothetical protein [Hoeflea sp.]
MTEDAIEDPLADSVGSDGVRTWQIFLRNGDKIEFRAAWNTNQQFSPGVFVSHVATCHRTGGRPDIGINVVYTFPKTNNSDVGAIRLAIDVIEVAAVVQIP